MVEGTTAATPQEMEEGHMMDDSIDLDDDGDFHDNLEDHFSQSHHSTATTRQII